MESTGKVRGGRRWRNYANKLPPTSFGGSVVELVAEDYESSAIRERERVALSDRSPHSDTQVGLRQASVCV